MNKEMLWDISIELSDKILDFVNEEIKIGKINRKNFDDAVLIGCLFNCQVITLLKTIRISDQENIYNLSLKEIEEYENLVRTLETNVQNTIKSAIELIEYNNQTEKIT